MFKALLFTVFTSELMMADSKPETEFVECGLCYENDELKRLPCSPGHILCVTCLTKDSSETKIIQCPFCK